MTKPNKKTNKVEKEDFIKILMSLSPEELNDMIKERGKPPKIINAFIRINNKVSQN